MRTVIHKTTAKFLEDIAQPPADELKEPQPIRRYARLAAIAVAGALILAAVVVMAKRIPKLQSEKKDLPSDPNSTDELKKLLVQVQNNVSVDINCPCQNQVMSWCDVTTFHIYTGSDQINASTPTAIYNFTKDEGGRKLSRDICNTRGDDFYTNICNQILSPILNSKDSRTFLPTARALASPDLLYHEIATRIDTNAYEQDNVHYFLNFTSNTARNFNYSKAVVALVRDMRNQFGRNSFSSTKDYWNASRETRAMYSQVRFAYGMDVSWDTYLQTCKPAFCEVEYEISGLNRALRAMGQVGGITTVVTLALKFIIWPALKLAMNSPTCKPLESNV